MKIVIERCAHCRTQYHYQASGLGAGPNNHPEYCEQCWGVIKDALITVRVRFKFAFVPQSEVTIDQVERWEKEWQSEHRGLLPIARRVFPSLYDMDAGEHSCYGIVKGREEYADRIFNYSYWPSRRSEAKIGIGVEVDMITGEMRECKEEFGPSIINYR